MKNRTITEYLSQAASLTGLAVQRCYDCRRSAQFEHDEENVIHWAKQEGRIDQLREMLDEIAEEFS